MKLVKFREKVKPSRTSSEKFFGCGGGTCNHRIARKCVRDCLFGAARSHPTRRGGSEVVRRLDFVSKKEQHPCGCCSFFGCGGGTCNHRIARKCVRDCLFGAARSHPTRRGGSEVVRRLDFVSKKEQHPCGCCSFFVSRR